MVITKPSLLSPDTGAKILDIVAQATTKQRVAIKLDLAFANNWSRCKWAYVVDLDNEVLEVYMGAVSKVQAVSERFNSVGEKDVAVPALVKSFPFAQLTTEADFLVALKEDLGESNLTKIYYWTRDQTVSE